jgi:SAM-dependent methyltransferase
MTKTAPALGIFQGTAAYYARYRSRYPAEVIDLLIERFDLNEWTHVMDLGCGTGQLAIPLAARRIPLHAVDPDIDMLVEGLRAERANGVRGIAWYTGSDSCLDQLRLPPLKLCTMGSSFHWMKQDEVLKALDHLILPWAVLPSSGSIA